MRLLYLFLLLPWVLSAQGPDRIQLTDGTVVEGKIRPTTAAAQSHEIQVRRGPERVTYAADEVAAVRFAGSGRRLERVTIESSETGGEREVRLGEVLAEGDLRLLRVNLYAEEYHTEAEGSEPYLYVLEAAGHTFVLRLTSIVVYEQWHANPAQFRNLLKFVTRDCPQAHEQASRAGFRDGSLLTVLQTYVQCHPDLAVTFNQRRLEGGVAVDHYAQLLTVDIRDGDFTDQRLSAGVGYRAEFRLTERFERFSAMVSAHYVYHSFSWQEQRGISQSLVRGNFSLGYTLVRRSDYAVQVTGGLSNYHAVSSSFRSFFSNNYFLLNGGLQLVRAPYVVALHYEHLPGQIPRRPANQLLATVGYRFGD